MVTSDHYYPIAHEPDVINKCFALLHRLNGYDRVNSSRTEVAPLAWSPPRQGIQATLARVSS